MKNLLLTVIIFCGIFIPFKAKAEPVTMVVLAPLALEAAKMASPYAISALHSGGAQLYEIGKDCANILLLPFGLLQATLGAPFGYFGNGVENIVLGLAAPFQLVGDILILPLSFINGAAGG